MTSNLLEKVKFKFLNNDSFNLSDIEINISSEIIYKGLNKIKHLTILQKMRRTNLNIEILTKNGLSKYIGPKILKDVLYV